MKQLYRILPIALSVGIFGCSNSSTPENTTATKTAANTTTEDQEKFVSRLPDDALVLKVATTGNLAPYSFQDNYGNLQGIDIDTIRAIGEDQGFKVEFYKETWEDMFDSVASGTRDLAMSGIYYSEDRAAKYSLSKPYLFNPSAVMYIEGQQEVTGLNDIDGLRVGALRGSKQEDQLEKAGGYNTLTTTDTGFLLYRELIQKKIDAAFLDAPILQYTAKNYPEYKVKVVPYESKDDPTAQVVVLMSPFNTELTNKINAGIENLEKEGTFDKIEQKWLGQQSSTSADSTSETVKEGA